MFKRLLQLRALISPSTLHTKKLSSTKQTLYISNETCTTLRPSNGDADKKWDVYSAVYVERHPLIIKPMNDIEQRYSEMLRTIQYENSHLSDHELKKIVEEEQAKRAIITSSVEGLSKETAQDKEDAALKELNRFTFAPIVTEDDKCDNLKSINRQLDSCLVLLTEHKYTKAEFIPPQGPRLDGETLRQAAERVLLEACGPNLKVNIYGNAPVGYYKYRYPHAMREKGICGAKVFYFIAKYISGQPTCKNCLWVDQEYLSKKLPKNIYKCVSQFTIAT